MPANNDLRSRAFLDADGYIIGANKIINAQDRIIAGTRRGNKGLRQQSHLYAQIARTADDAQYGLHGVRNNLIEIAISSGAGGPVILALTGTLLLVQYLTKDMNLFKGSIEGVRKEFKKYGTDLVTHLGQEAAVQEELAKQADATAERTRAQARHAGASAEQADKLADKSRAIANSHRESAEALRKAQSDLINANAKEEARAKAAKENKDAQAEINRILKERAQIDADLETLLGPTFGASGADAQYKALKDAEKNLGLGDGDFSLIDANDVEILEDYTDGVDDLTAALRMVKSPLAELSFEQAKTFKGIEENLQKVKDSVHANIATSFVNAFDAAASSSGSFIENLAQGLLSGLGSVLIQLGTAAILAGIAKNAIIPGSGAKSITQGALVVAGGVALKAGASLIGKGSSSSTGGGGSRSSQSPAVASNALSIEQGKITGSRGLRSSTTRGEDIRYNQQVANDNYQAYS